MTQQLLLLIVLLCLCHKAAAVTRMVVMEGQDVLLSCSIGSSTNIQLELFDWKKDSQKEVFMYDRGSHYNKDRSDQDPQFKGRVFHFPEELQHGNASVLLRHSQVEDSGSYTCDFPFHQPSRRADVQLIVDPLLKPRPDVRGAAPEPYVTSLDQTKDWSRLQCSVKGAFPKPMVQWQDRSGLVLPAEEAQVSERGGSYDIILQTTVTKTGHYRCVATQEEIKHQVYAEIYVYIGGTASKPFFRILSSPESGVLLQCEVLGASPEPKVQWQDSSGNIIDAEEPEVSERGGSYDIILRTTVTKTDFYQCVVTQEQIKHKVQTKTLVLVPETFVPVHSEQHTGWTPGIIVGAIVGTFVVTLLVVAAVLFVLMKSGHLRCADAKNSMINGTTKDAAVGRPLVSTG